MQKQNSFVVMVDLLSKELVWQEEKIAQLTNELSQTKEDLSSAMTKIDILERTGRFHSEDLEWEEKRNQVLEKGLVAAQQEIGELKAKLQEKGQTHSNIWVSHRTGFPKLDANIHEKLLGYLMDPGLKLSEAKDRIQAIKYIREMCRPAGWGLKEAKDFVEVWHKSMPVPDNMRSTLDFILGWSRKQEVIDFMVDKGHEFLFPKEDSVFQKISCIKGVRDLTKWGLKETNNFVSDYQKEFPSNYGNNFDEAVKKTVEDCWP